MKRYLLHEISRNKRYKEEWKNGFGDYYENRKNGLSTERMWTSTTMKKAERCRLLWEKKS